MVAEMEVIINEEIASLKSARRFITIIVKISNKERYKSKNRNPNEKDGRIDG